VVVATLSWLKKRNQYAEGHHGEEDWRRGRDLHEAEEDA
jgi:hypothetical protein